MALTHIPLDRITDGHLSALIKAGAAESLHIEYKRETYGGNDDARREFLADISSFANSVGGDLVIGIAAGSVSARANKYSRLDEGRDFLRRLPTRSKPLRCGEESGTCGSRRRLSDWFGSGNGGSYATRRRPCKIGWRIAGP